MTIKQKIVRCITPSQPSPTGEGEAKPFLLGENERG